MKSPTYLILSRHGIYYFRYPLSTLLHPQGKPSYIKLSLETRCPRLALRLCRLLSTLADSLLRNPRVLCMDYIEIRDLLTKHFKQHFEATKAQIHKHGRLTAYDRAMYESQMAVTMPPLAKEANDLYASRDTMIRLIDHYTLPVQHGTQEYDLLREELNKAGHGYAKSVLDYDAGLEDYKFLNAPEAVTINQATTENSGKKLAVIFPRFIQEKVLGKEWNKKFGREAQGYFEILDEFLGPNAPLYVSPDAASSVKQMLMQLPKHSRAHTHLKAMGLQDLAALPEDHPYKKGKLMERNSVRKYLITFSGFYDWAIRHKHTSENNFADIIPEVDRRPKKDPFSPEQLALITPVIMAEEKEHFRWGALMLRYTGARKEEIAQMRVADVKQKDGIWCFDIEETNEEDDNDVLQPKKLKNLASRRTVPIHPRLLELGILDYIEQAKNKGDGRILYQLNFHPTNGYGRGLSRWFNERLLVDLGIKTRRLSMHSLRHTAITEMLQRGVTDPIMKAVVGHTREGVAHLFYFGAGYKMEQLREAVEKIG